ncbi:TrbI/VirB10 family protein [Luteibacter sp. CQ10]|uniref:TrbI/VirB10 family protein n=1 Tax=Luteibacter sp. CQ10 TaxID=2805821 RepID=UPI0034A49565
MNQNMSPQNDGEIVNAEAPQADAQAKQDARIDFNPYVRPAGHQEDAQPNLDENAPDLAKHEERRLNRKALGLLASIAALLAVIIAWVLNAPDGQTTHTRPREEVLTVPTAPEARFERPDTMPMMPVVPPADPIPLRSAVSRIRESFEHPEPPEAPRGPSLVERRIAAASQGTTGVSDGVSTGGAAGFPMPPYPVDPSMQRAEPSMSATGNLAYTAKALPNVSNASPLTHPDTLMLRGTYIRCVLETRIITDIPGFTSCVIHEPIYSFTGKRLLLPKGSKVQGKYAMEPNGPRVAVIWDRIITPTGIDVNMASPGVDSLGSAGHPGHYNAHWGSRIGSALMLSLFSDTFKYVAAKHGPPQTTITNGVVTQNPFESNTAATIQSLANSALARGANRPATVTINQGTVLAVYVAKDVDFSGVVARNGQGRSL